MHQKATGNIELHAKNEKYVEYFVPLNSRACTLQVFVHSAGVRALCRCPTGRGKGGEGSPVFMQEGTSK
jgi:hypothetical protein